eukprot:SAG31_NODE_1223_length_9288_cov_8.411253_4_plen_54_part_00
MAIVPLHGQRNCLKHQSLAVGANSIDNFTMTPWYDHDSVRSKNSEEQQLDGIM